MRISPYGQSCVLINLSEEVSEENSLKVQKICIALEQLELSFIASVIPSYCSIAVKYLPSKINFSELNELIKGLDYENVLLPTEKEHVIPVCYDKSLAQDLDVVCNITSLSPKEVMELHVESTYSIFAIGFVPGFFYLGGLNPKLVVPRKEVPLVKVPKGAVGIAANQTGIYPLETPGGWQLIGRTPLPSLLFDPLEVDKYKIGDRIRFEPISLNTFKKLCDG